MSCRGASAADVIDGAVEVLTEAKCTLVGGHSIDDQTPKFGFAITGTVHPDRFISNDAARPGDLLILTKALGTGSDRNGHQEAAKRRRHPRRPPSRPCGV